MGIILGEVDYAGQKHPMQGLAALIILGGL